MSKQDFQKWMDETHTEVKGINKVRQIADKVYLEIYENSIEPVILRAAEKGLYETTISYIEYDAYSLSKFLERMGYGVEVGIGDIITVSWH